MFGQGTNIARGSTNTSLGSILSQLGASSWRPFPKLPEYANSGLLCAGAADALSQIRRCWEDGGMRRLADRAAPAVPGDFQ